CELVGEAEAFTPRSLVPQHDADGEPGAKLISRGVTRHGISYRALVGAVTLRLSQVQPAQAYARAERFFKVAPGLIKVVGANFVGEQIELEPDRGIGAQPTGPREQLISLLHSVFIRMTADRKMKFLQLLCAPECCRNILFFERRDLIGR